MTLERFQIKSFRECWFLLDDKLGLYAGFNTYDMAMKSKLACEKELHWTEKIKWIPHSEMISNG